MPRYTIHVIGCSPVTYSERAGSARWAIIPENAWAADYDRPAPVPLRVNKKSPSLVAHP